jgi:hypothetical protein
LGQKNAIDSTAAMFLSLFHNYSLTLPLSLMTASSPSVVVVVIVIVVAELVVIASPSDISVGNCSAYWPAIVDVEDSSAIGVEGTI